MIINPPTFPACDECRHRLTFAAFGVDFGLRSNDPDLLQRASQALPPGSDTAADDVTLWFTLQRSLPSSVGAPRHRLFKNDTVVAEGIRLSPILEALEDELRLAVASGTRTHVFVHAGVVRAAGGVIVLPGRSETGKTTLVRALVDAGAEYWSDEYAVFDEQGLVWPYPRRVSIRQGSNRRHREWLAGPSSPEPQPMRLLLATGYEAGASWAPRSLSAGDAAMALFNHTLVARMRPAFALQVLSKAVEGARALAGPRGEAAHFAAAVLHNVAAS